MPAAESPQTQSKLEEVTLESWEVPKPRRAVALEGGGLVEVFWVAACQERELGRENLGVEAENAAADK